MITRVTRRNDRGFTLIEVLVVVAIIALLISILLPSLKQARELARLTICQTHQKNIGNGMQMYFGDNQDSMPGPIHPMFLAHPELLGDLNNDGKIEGADEKFVASGYVNTRLRKYMGDRMFGKGQNMKEVGTDPSFPIKDAQFENIPVYNYAINSSDLTAPWLYFGFTHGGITSQGGWDSSTLAKTPIERKHNPPKKLSKIFSGVGPGGNNWKFSPSTEWMMADAFRRPLRAGQCGTWPTANEPGNESFSDIPSPVWKQNAEWGSLSDKVHGSGTSASAKVAPFQPYHIGGGFKKFASGETKFTGKVATLYFDMHVAAQQDWAGTKFSRKICEAYKVPTLRD